MSKEMEKFAYDGYPPLEPDDPNLNTRLKDLLLPGIYERLPSHCEADVTGIIDQTAGLYRSGGKSALCRGFRRILDGYAIKR